MPTATQTIKQRRLDQQLAELEDGLQQRRLAAEPQLATWIADYQRQHPLPSLPSDPVLYCPLDESAGDTVASSAGAVGKLIGPQAWDTGHLGGGLRLDGQTHVEFADVCDFDHTDSFSATGWIYIDGEGAMTIVSRMDDADAFRGYDFYLGDGRLFVHLIHHWDDDAIRVNTRQPLVRQKWQHVCFTYDGSGRASGITIYVNGQAEELEVTHDTLTATIRTAAIAFGATPHGGSICGDAG